MYYIQSCTLGYIARHHLSLQSIASGLRRQNLRLLRCTYLNEELKAQVKIGTSSGHVVLNDLQWFILVTFKSNLPKIELYELGEPLHTLSMNCGRCIRITSENTKV